MSPAKRKASTSRKSASAKKTSAKKTSAKKTSAKKTSAKKTSAKKTSAKKTKATSPEFFDHNVAVARELAGLAESHAVSELIYETDALTLTIRRGDGAPAQYSQLVAAPTAMAMPVASVAPSAPAAAPAAAAPEEDDNLHIVTSPFVGTFYRSPSPDATSYVEPGQSVTKGQVLCIVEAMKLMNEIEADRRR